MKTPPDDSNVAVIVLAFIFAVGVVAWIVGL